VKTAASAIRASVRSIETFTAADIQNLPFTPDAELGGTGSFSSLASYVYRVSSRDKSSA
jgi:hypothetical protein